MTCKASYTTWLCNHVLSECKQTRIPCVYNEHATVSELFRCSSNGHATAITKLALYASSAAAEWRQKNEIISLLEAGIPFTQRGAGGADVWPLCLRDNWTRYVPLGNIFSGLFVEIREKKAAEQSA